MRASETERIRALQAAVAAREQEIEALKEQKSQLQSQLVTASASGEDLLGCYPVYDYCGRKPRKNIRDVPVEQYSNIIVQFEVATKGVEHQNAQDLLAMTELKTYIREQERAERMWVEKKKKLAEKIGFDLPSSSPARRAQLMELQGYQPEADAEEIEARKKIVAREINAALFLRYCKGKTIEIMKNKLKERDGMVDVIDQLYNNIRVADRDLELLNQEMDKLRASEEGVIQCIEDKETEAGNQQILIEQVEQLVQTIKEEKEVLLLDTCEPQERILKAQDYRLQQLEKRLKVTERCLRNNCSIKDVKAILETKWESASPETLELRDDLMDIDRIIPADEKIHPALYNLFLREKEILAQAICKINILVAEKESVMASQACKLEALSRACNQSIQDLDDVANSAAFDEEKQRQLALDWARQQRTLYLALLREKTTLEARR